MNTQKVMVGTVSVFLGFLVPVLSHGLWAISSTIQNAGRMIGDDGPMEHIWSKADLQNFIYQMPWIMWVYFIPMTAMGVFLIVAGLIDRPTSRIEQNSPASAGQ